MSETTLEPHFPLSAVRERRFAADDLQSTTASCQPLAQSPPRWPRRGLRCV